MPIQIDFSPQDIDELFEEMRQQMGAALSVEGNEQTLQIPDRLGSGWNQQLELRPGLKLMIQNAHFHKAVNLRFEGEVPVSSVELGFCLSGTFRKTTYGAQKVCLASGQGCLGFVPYFQETASFLAEQSLLMVIAVDRSTLSMLIDGQLDQVPLPLQALVEGGDTPFHIPILRVSPQTQLALQQILNCPYQGLTKRLYIESKVLEAIAHSLQQCRPKSGTLASSDMPIQDIERIHHAKEILLKNLEQPPSLLELARQVGLNDYKLKQGFRQVLGTTAFGYLHQCRMDKARSLLQTTSLSITEVAGTVGYSSLSAFNAAFKRHFGFNPSAYRLHSW